jgi:hypothetical protein
LLHSKNRRCPSLLPLNGQKPQQELSLIGSDVRTRPYNTSTPAAEFSNFGLLDYSEYENNYGSIRRYYVLKEYLKGSTTEDNVLQIYKKWRDENEFLVLRGFKAIFEGFERQSHTEAEYLFVKACKRGNDVYVRRIKERLEPLNKAIERDISLFDTENPKDRKPRKTPLLFITLEYNANKYSIPECWFNCGWDWDNFTKLLSREYGAKIEFFRSWQAHQSYYPHIHAVVYFPNRSFLVRPIKNKKDKIVWRIPDKEVQKIKSFWPYGFVDIRGVSNTKKALLEVKKYCTRELWGEKGEKSMAMCWLFGKRSFSATKDFFPTLGGYFEFKEPNTSDEIDTAMHNYFAFEFLGIIKASKFHISPKIWHFTTKHPPPGVLKELLEQEKERNFTRSSSGSWGFNSRD